MSSKELQYLLRNDIENYLSGIGYEIIKEKFDEKFYVKNVDGVEQRIILIYAHYGTLLTVQPLIALNFESIVEIYQKNTTFRSRPYLCLGNHLLEIERFVKNGEKTERVYVNYDWELRTEEEVIEFVKQFKNYMNTVIAPYFDQNSSLNQVDLLLNENPRVSSIHNNTNPLRACVAIIAAKLNKNPKFDEILSIYDETIKKGEESYQTDYQNIRSFLLKDPT